MRFTMICCLALSLPVAAQARGLPVYTVDVDEKLERLGVVACFDRDPPETLYAEDDSAGRYLIDTRDPRVPSGSARPPAAGKRSEMTASPDHDGCVRYGVDLTAGTSGGFRSPVVRRPGAVLLSPHIFLRYREADGEVEVRFRLPDGVGVSAPWRKVAGGARTPSYRTGDRPTSWDARIALGDLSAHAIRLPGGTLDVALLPADPPAGTRKTLRWLRRNADALVSAYGRLPLEHVQVLVVPLGAGKEPVPWGEVQRGGGDAVHLYIDQRRGEQAFMDDWVLLHELSHLLHPPMRGQARWLYEGLASYYQNALRARTGLLDEEAAWQKLHAGFRRGMAETERGTTLAEAARRMPWTREYMRVYWSGAAIALLADLQLRRTSGGKQSLDTALAAFRRCCLPADRQWTDRELIDKLDALTGRSGDSRVFDRLYRRWLDSDRFPDLAGAYRALGLTVERGGELELAGDSAARGLRRTIMCRGC